MSSERFVSKKIMDLPYSGIRKFFDVAKTMKGVVSLGVGEPDFETPWNIREAAIYHMEHHRSTYTSNAGLEELRDEISKYMKRKYNLHYNGREQTVVTIGASEGLDIALRAILEPGDEVLVVDPCFVSYKPCVIMAGGVPVVINTTEENNFRVKAEDIERAITPKTKAIMISYPNNPTGAVLEKEDLEEIVELLKDKDIVVLSDEIYSELTYTGNTHISIASFPEMYEKTIVFNGFSKAFSMTGWRLGFVCGPKEIIAAMTKIHQYIVMCAATTAQYAGVEALKNSDDSVVAMQREYNARRRLIVNGFREIGFSTFEPLGAFYVFPSIKSTGLNTLDFCNRLLYEEKVAVVPGNAFGESGEGHIRCAYAYSVEEIKIVLEKIAGFVEKLKSE